MAGISSLSVCVVLLGIGFLPIAFAQGTAAQLEGSKPYAPTRLEWLAVELNAQLRTDATPEHDYLVSFVPLAKEDSILIYVVYRPTVNREAMNTELDAARKIISIIAKSRGWSSWLKVKERIEMNESK